jgi:hypothetical protein
MSVERDRREWYMQGLFIAEEKQGKQLVTPLQIAFFVKGRKGGRPYNPFLIINLKPVLFYS